MKLIKFALPLIILIFYTSSSFAEDSKKDCALIETDTGSGMYEKWKCNKGFKGFGEKIKNLWKKKDKS